MPELCYNILTICHLSPAQIQRISRACQSRSIDDDVWGREAFDTNFSEFAGGVSIDFTTAWVPPDQEWVEALSVAMPKAHIELCYEGGFQNSEFSGKTVAHNGVAVNKCLDSLHPVYKAWVKRTQRAGVSEATLDDDDDEADDDDDGDDYDDNDDDDDDDDDEDGEWYDNEEWNNVQEDEIDMALRALSPPFPALECQSCLRPIASLVLSAAAACSVFDRRSMRAHYLQPPAQLGLTPSQRSLEIASLQLWCRDNKQRVQLQCCSSPLSTLAFRLARAVNRHEGSRSFEVRAMAGIMRRCFCMLAWRFWTGRECELADENDDHHVDND